MTLRFLARRSPVSKDAGLMPNDSTNLRDAGSRGIYWDDLFLHVQEISLSRRSCREPAAARGTAGSSRRIRGKRQRRRQIARHRGPEHPTNHRQRDIGLDILTDGEFRRASWLTDMADAVEGFVSDRVVLDWKGPGGGPEVSTANAVGGKLRQHRKLTALELPLFNRKLARPSR